MRNTARIMLIGLLALSLFGCATLFVKGGADYRRGERELSSGAYADAARSALEALAKNPEFPEAYDLLNRVYEIGTSTLKGKISSYENSGDKFRFDGIWPLYQQLHDLHSTIAASTYSHMYETGSFTEQVAENRIMAAEAHYQEGVALLSEGYFRSARKAAAHFQAALETERGYKDAADLQEQARQAGVASLLIYSPQSDDTLIYFMRQELEGDSSVSQFTRFIEPGALGLDGGYNLVQVTERAKRNAVDFVLFIESFGSGDSDMRNDRNVPLANGAVTGSTFYYGYNIRLAGSYRLVDVAQGAQLVNAEFDKRASDELSVTLITDTDSGNLNLENLGEGHYSWVSVYDVYNAPGFMQLKNDASYFVRNTYVRDLDDCDDFYDLKQLMNGKVWFYSVDLIHDQATGGYFPLYANDRSENSMYRDTATSLWNHFKLDARQLMQEASEKSYLLSDDVAEQVGKEVIPQIR